MFEGFKKPTRGFPSLLSPVHQTSHSINPILLTFAVSTFHGCTEAHRATIRFNARQIGRATASRIGYIIVDAVRLENVYNTLEYIIHYTISNVRKNP